MVEASISATLAVVNTPEDEPAEIAASELRTRKFESVPSRPSASVAPQAVKAYEAAP